MADENNFIKHIVETKKIVDEWPEWKKNSLGGGDYKARSIKVLSQENFNKKELAKKQ